MDEGSVIEGLWEPVDERRCELGEGARFIAPEGFGEEQFVCVDLLRGRLFSTAGHSGSGLVPRAELGRPLGAVARLRGEPAVWVGALGEGLSLLAEEGETLVERELLGSPAADRPVRLRMNDAVADPHGRFWAGAMAYDGDEGQGFLARLDMDGTVTVVIEGMSIPNGPAFSADGRAMYLADTPTGRIRTYDVDPATGGLGEGRDFVHVEEGGPDGMTVDAEGCLWVAIWGASCLHRYSPEGVLLERIPVPARQPTSVAISSAPPYRAVVTSAAIGLEAPEAHDGRVLTAPVAVAGIPAAPFG